MQQYSCLSMHLKNTTPKFLLFFSAVADLITMLAYIPYTLQFFIIYGSDPNEQRNSFPAACYLTAHTIVTVIAHTTSIWLTICVAIFRYLCVGSTSHHSYCTMRRVKIAIVAVVVGSIIIHIPYIASYNIQQLVNSTDRYDNMTMYYLTTDIEKNGDLKMVKFVSMAVFVKLGPCVILTVMSALLIRTILKVAKKYEQLHQASGNNNVYKPSASSNAERQRHKQTRKTTELIIAVLVFFIIAESPQGILFLLTGLSKHFFVEVYHPLGNLLDLVTIVSCCINFTLYCVMSSKFKAQFALFLRRLFCCRKTADRRELPQSNGLTSAEDRL